MTGSDDEGTDPDEAPRNVPTVSCARCDDEWTLEYELDELTVGNRALEAFALDHHQHTGHFPDDVTPWMADCERCPESVRRLEEAGVTRWAETHARHTGHRVRVDHASREEPTVVERERD